MGCKISPCRNASSKFSVRETGIYITCSCYHRLPFLGSALRRDLFLKILEETRKKYQFFVAGYVVMPEHFHLSIGETTIKNPSIVMQVLKQRVARKCRPRKREAQQAAQTHHQRTAARSGRHAFTISTWAPRQVCGEARLHPLQSGETRTGFVSRVMAGCPTLCAA